ncbi:MAG: AMP-dependent synthetase [Proteobacteria bacterium]|nr:MAG: AMP-dependent synthetase [Pseudomonadota bacterium]
MPNHFRWHTDTRLHWPSQSATQHTFDSLHDNTATPHEIMLISDACSVTCFTALQYAIQHRRAFCIHPQNASFSATIPPQKETDGYFQTISSGSSGTPKRIRRTQASWITSFQINTTQAQITPEDSYAILGKLSHSTPLYATLEAAHIGADIHVLSDLRPDHQRQALSHLQSTILYATPTQLRLLCKQRHHHVPERFAVRLILSGGGKLDAHTAALVHQTFVGATVIEFYGAAETSFITLSDHHTPIGSVGKAYPKVQIRIDPPDTDGDLAGKIWVKSPYLFTDYAVSNSLEPPKYAATWRDGFLSVGEYGYQDKQGYLFLSGRQSRRINIADQLVHPEEIELLLLANPAVEQCAIVPVTDTQRGQVLMGLVVLSCETMSADNICQELLATLRQQPGNLITPRKLFPVESLPKLASGKVDLVAATELVRSLYEAT